MIRLNPPGIALARLNVELCHPYTVIEPSECRVRKLPTRIHRDTCMQKDKTGRTQIEWKQRAGQKQKGSTRVHYPRYVPSVYESTSTILSIRSKERRTTWTKCRVRSSRIYSSTIIWVQFKEVATIKRGGGRGGEVGGSPEAFCSDLIITALIHLVQNRRDVLRLRE